MPRAVRVPRASNCDLARTVSWGDGFEGANPCSCVHRNKSFLNCRFIGYCLAVLSAIAWRSASLMCARAAGLPEDREFDSELGSMRHVGRVPVPCIQNGGVSDEDLRKGRTC